MSSQTKFYARSFAIAALSIPASLLVLSWIIPFMRPRWDSSIMPLLSLFGGIVPAVIAIFWSIVGLKQRSNGATASLLLAITAIPVSLFVTWWLAMMGLATHPV